MGATDGMLLDRWRLRRDASAVAELVARHAGMVYGTCRRVTRDGIAAEDVAQECFLTLIQHQQAPPRNLGGWLHRVAVRRSLDYLRGSQRRSAREAAAAPVTAVHDDPAWEEIVQHVDEAVAGLPEKLREPIILHYFEGRTHAEIARALGITRSGVTRRIARGTEEIRAALEERGIHRATLAGLAALLLAHGAEAATPALISKLGHYALAQSSLPAAATKVAVLHTGGLLKLLGASCVAAVAIAAIVLTTRGTDRLPAAAATLNSSGVDAISAPALEVASATLPAPEEIPVPANETPENTKDFLTCVDRQGNPVSGAEVYFVGIAMSKGMNHVDHTRVWETIGPLIADEQGRVALPRFEAINISTISAYARVPDHKVGAWTRSYPPVSDADQILTMGDALKLSGQVSVPAGFLHSQVQVRVLSFAVEDGQNRYGNGFALQDPPEAIWPRFFTQQCDASGRFTLPDLPKDGRIYLSATAPGLAEEQFYSFDPASAQSLRLEMKPESVITGTVRHAETGSPAVGYTVFATAKSGGVTYPHQTKSQPDGSYRIGGLYAGEHRVAVAPKTFPPREVAVVHDWLVLEVGEVVEQVDLTLETGVVIEGTVAESVGGAPVPEVWVVALSPASVGGQAIGTGISDTEGRYQLRLPAGTSRLYLASVPKEYLYPKDQAQRMVEVPLGVQNVPQVHFTLERRTEPSPLLEKARVTGRVVTAEGTPVADASIGHDWKYQYDGAERSEGNPRLGRTNSEGEYSVEITASGEHSITAGKAGLTKAESETFSIDKDQTKRLPDLVLEPAIGWVSGVVVDGEGNPIAGAEVRVSGKRYFSPGSQGPLRDAVTDGEGRFLVEHVPDTDEIGVFVSRPGFEYWSGRAEVYEETQITMEYKQEDGPEQ